MFHQNITKCLVVLFVFSTLLGSMKANEPSTTPETEKPSTTPETEEQEDVSRIQSNPVDANDVNYRQVMQEGGFGALGNWILYDKVPESSSTPVTAKVDSIHDLDSDAKKPYTTPHMS